MHKVIFLNGPPGAGKDRAARIMMKAYPNIRHRKFSAHLKEVGAVMYQLTAAEVKEFDFDQASKDMPRAALFGKSWRQTLIWLSEKVMKPEFGESYFGDMLLRQMQQPTGSKITAISDSGFVKEAMPLIAEYGAPNCLIVQLTRPGHSFDGDSRNYWTYPWVPMVSVNNLFDLPMFRVQILSRVDKFLSFERPNYD